ncbi:hypothetical protein FBZ84_101130 [Azospirillum baldaniorum]|uniref:hypothetical protein n=1 Tax=Azospirillum baldaniorum TaxID=1064539 RepID=UPI0011A77D50|nr:hypothetical protein [Azospirillum baldaniorum]TWA71864.1 hypothetical protein FBZ84_101130 [Azospirillum baldaniorum]
MSDTLEAPKAATGKGLAIIADLTPEIFTPEKAAEIIADVRREVMSIDRDISSKKGREAIASMAAKIARSKTAADNFGKQLKADYKAKVDAIDGIRRVFWDGLEALQKEFRAPLTEFEEAEKARIAGHEAGIADIQAMPLFSGDHTTDDIADRLAKAQAIDASGFQEFTARAEAAKAAAIATLTAALENSRARDAERAELERLRREAEERAAREEAERIEREKQEAAARAAEQARRDAEEKARQERDEAERAAAAERERIEREAQAERDRATAEQARVEREKREAEERATKAEQDRQDALRRAKEAEEQAERDRVAAEERAQQRVEEAAQRERQRIADEQKAEEEAQRRREEDRAHRGAINRAAMQALIAAMADAHSGNATEAEAIARAIVSAIARGAVPAVKISY